MRKLRTVSIELMTLEVVVDVEYLVVGVTRVLVEACVVLLHFVVGQVEHVDAGVVFELVVAADEPHFVLIVDHLGLAERQGQLDGREFKVGLLAVVPVEPLHAVDNLALHVLAPEDLELHFAFLLLEPEGCVVSRGDEVVLEHAGVLHDALHFAFDGRTVLIVLSAHNQDLLFEFVLLDRAEGAFLLHLPHAFIDEGLGVQSPHFVLLGLVGFEGGDSTQELDLVVAVGHDGAAVLGLLAFVEAGSRNLALHVFGEVDGVEGGACDGQPAFALGHEVVVDWVYLRVDLVFELLEGHLRGVEHVLHQVGVVLRVLFAGHVLFD
eukprot:CAMPEP_0116909530 /NCGR_PEP_ID=MMETSP0467-20121206/14332_1 /TAXON_ID=283647 /ORGANISM="Mesodinium pulex, Strain SPMC105" /LENGTH=321 /DNA_ID=CAMNT_0004584909 /DNA_START=241 /DNA_END=1205 /DNA_ORIENTATION=+